MNQCDINQYVKYMIPKINKYYIHRDESHGLEHVINVTNNAITIANTYDLNELEYKIIILSSLLHDAYDSKYITDVQYIINDISHLLNDEGYSREHMDLIHNIIKNISFSKEVKERESNNDLLKIIKHFDSDKEQLLRDIVSDADKIESLGITGIIRIIQYQNEMMNKNIVPLSTIWYEIHLHHLHKIYNNRIVLLLSDNYIRTDIGRTIAKPFYHTIIDTFSNCDLLYDYINSVYNTVFNKN